MLVSVIEENGEGEQGYSVGAGEERLGVEGEGRQARNRENKARRVLLLFGVQRRSLDGQAGVAQEAKRQTKRQGSVGSWWQ